MKILEKIATAIIGGLLFAIIVGLLAWAAQAIWTAVL